MRLEQYCDKILNEAQKQVKTNKLLPDKALWRAIDLLLPPRTSQSEKTALFKTLMPRVRDEQERELRRAKSNPLAEPTENKQKKGPLEIPQEKQLSFKLK